MKTWIPRHVLIILEDGEVSITLVTISYIGRNTPAGSLVTGHRVLLLVCFIHFVCAPDEGDGQCVTSGGAGYIVMFRGELGNVL